MASPPQEPAHPCVDIALANIPEGKVESIGHDTLSGPRCGARHDITMALSASQKRYLRSFAHDLKPVILVGQKGITEALLAELDGALAHHELVKVKLGGDDRDERTQSIDIILGHSGAELVQAIGKTATFFLRNPKQSQFALPR